MEEEEGGCLGLSREGDRASEGGTGGRRQDGSRGRAKQICSMKKKESKWGEKEQRNLRKCPVVPAASKESR